MKELRKFIATTIREYLNENQSDISYKRNTMSKEMREQIDKVKNWRELLNEGETNKENTESFSMQKSGQDIGIKDANGNDIFVGSVIEFNGELFLIKWSDKQNQFVARKEPLKGQKMSWRDMKWIDKLANKYIKMVGTILFDEEMRQRFKGVYK